MKNHISYVLPIFFKVPKKSQTKLFMAYERLGKRTDKNSTFQHRGGKVGFDGMRLNISGCCNVVENILYYIFVFLLSVVIISVPLVY